jgi:outer membrane protein OmpA-like peptidoglycan-associated protein
MLNVKGRFLAGALLSALVFASVDAAPLGGIFVVAQAPQSDQEKEKKPPQRPAQPQPPSPKAQQQQQQVQPPSPKPQQRQVQPPPPPLKQQQVQPPPPPPPPKQQEVQPPPPSPQKQQQVQPPPSPQQQPSQGAQPSPSVQQQGQRATGATIQPPRPIAPQQPVGKPAIAPSALQPSPPPPGSPAAQAQRAFVPPPARDSARRLDDLRGARKEVREGGRVMIEEPGRVIIQESGRTIIRHNDADRFRWQAQDVRVERRGTDTVAMFERPDGSRIYTVTDENGRLLRRYRRTPDGREIIIIDNHYSGPAMAFSFFVDLPPPVIRIPRERYIVDAEYAQPDDVYYALWAAPVDDVQRPYTLDEIRYSLPLRERMPSVDLDTVTFDTGSWEVAPDQVERLALIADGINRAIAVNPSEVFLIEGHTDAVGSEIDNLSLSDRRAESVALVLSQQFGVPAENLTTQGYGDQYLKIPTRGPERANRRVTVRRITPLLTGQNQAIPLSPQ